MIGAMWNGIAGIWQHDKGIAVESNNLANSNTVGHKKRPNKFFRPLYIIKQDLEKVYKLKLFQNSLSKGNIVQSGVGIDVAIEGKGFCSKK